MSFFIGMGFTFKKKNYFYLRMENPWQQVWNEISIFPITIPALRVCGSSVSDMRRSVSSCQEPLLFAPLKNLPDMTHKNLLGHELSVGARQRTLTKWHTMCDVGIK